MKYKYINRDLALEQVVERCHIYAIHGNICNSLDMECPCLIYLQPCITYTSQPTYSSKVILLLVFQQPDAITDSPKIYKCTLSIHREGNVLWLFASDLKLSTRCHFQFLMMYDKPLTYSIFISHSILSHSRWTRHSALYAPFKVPSRIGLLEKNIHYWKALTKYAFIKIVIFLDVLFPSGCLRMSVLN